MVKPTSLPIAQFSLFSADERPDAFRKAVQVIHSKPKKQLSLTQRKIGNAWMKHALATGPAEDGWWVISIIDLATDIGFDSNNREHLKQAAEALMSIVFEWDVISTNKKGAPWKASVLFPEVEIHPSYIKYQFSSQMRERLLAPEVYATIDMNIVRKFRRASSLAIWEHCVRYENIGQTANVEVSLFKDMILGEDANNKTYDEYKYFKSKILKPSVIEINTESNHLIELVETKMGRRVTAIRFLIKKKRPAQESNDSPDSIELLSEMIKLGVPQSEAKKILRTQPLNTVRSAITYTRNRILDKRLEKLERPAAYFRTALKNAYAAPEHETEREPKKPSIDLKAEFSKVRLQEAADYFKEIDIGDQQALMERYNVQQGVPQLRLKDKKTGKAAMVAFYGWLALDTWGEPSAEDLLAFAQNLIRAAD
jgi:hypothetical protein